MRQLGRLGVWYPVDRLDGAGIKHLLGTVEELGYSVLWYPVRNPRDPERRFQTIVSTQSTRS
jgi:hypothetical protein